MVVLLSNPYACVFIHYVFINYFPILSSSDIFIQDLYKNSDCFSPDCDDSEFNKAYTLFIFSLLILALLLTVIINPGY